MAKGSDDGSVLSHIDQLVQEEERLYSQSELADADRVRLAELKVQLDQCWDLLRQRAELCESLERTRTRRSSDQGRLSRITNNRSLHLQQSARLVKN